jgi:demethylmenaquinone methyltransferase/2-methoxy-6-polyprenyl-1,4-benzoquinol methylase
MFDAIAGRYDFLNHLLSAGRDRRWRRRAILSLSLQGHERVLDLCTGTGDLAIAARSNGSLSARRVVAVDFAAAMLQVGREKLLRLRATDAIALVRGDATRIPVRSQSIDAVTMAFGIRNVENVAAACGEICRVLKPGGRLAILEFGIPTAQPARAAYLWYFTRLLPRIGRIVSRHTAAYDYLPASVQAFPPSHEFVKVLRQSGFTDVAASRLTLGIVSLYTARRRTVDDKGFLIPNL